MKKIDSKLVKPLVIDSKPVSLEKIKAELGVLNTQGTKFIRDLSAVAIAEVDNPSADSRNALVIVTAIGPDPECNRR